MTPIRTFWKPFRLASRLVPVAACLLVAGCVWMMESSPPYDLTFRGRVTRGDNGAAVPGARVQIWTDHPVDVGTTAPFAEGQTSQTGDFRLRDELRQFGAPQTVTVRVTPAAGSGLREATFGGEMSDLFPSITGDDAKYTYTGSFVLQPAAAAGTRGP
jgi:hypothetical protein